VLFGSAKLPAAARSLGKSMRILKTEVSSLHDDEDETKAGQTTPAQLAAASAAAAPPVATPAPAATSQPSTEQVAENAAHQARIDSLEQQIREMKDSADKKAAVPADQQPR
jgi:sec-independent protein translocase protein TatA